MRRANHQPFSNFKIVMTFTDEVNTQQRRTCTDSYLKKKNAHKKKGKGKTSKCVRKKLGNRFLWRSLSIKIITPIEETNSRDVLKRPRYEIFTNLIFNTTIDRNMKFPEWMSQRIPKTDPAIKEKCRSSVRKSLWEQTYRDNRFRRKERSVSYQKQTRIHFLIDESVCFPSRLRQSEVVNTPLGTAFTWIFLLFHDI